MSHWKHLGASTFAALACLALAMPAHAQTAPAKPAAVPARVQAAAMPGSAQATAGQAKKPNILVIWGDDIGTWNISHNNRGMMGYQTPNIDRIANEGVSLHRLLRAAELHGRPGRVHRRQRAGAHRA